MGDTIVLYTDTLIRHIQIRHTSVPEFIDPVFVKTSPKRSFLVIENERFGLVFAKTGSINSDTGKRHGPIGVITEPAMPYFTD